MTTKLTDGALYISGDSKPFARGIQSISIEDENLPEYVSRAYIPLSTEAEASLECEIDSALFEKLTGCAAPPCKTFDIELKKPYQVQVRTHRKRRINKKWAKRYGYKTVFKTVILKDCEITADGETIDILGRFYTLRESYQKIKGEEK